MIGRRQLPVHSALTLRALLRGALGALGLNAQRALAARLCSHWGSRDVLFTSSGTSALSLALRAAAHEGNALAALPAYGCYDLATAAESAGVRVVLYDVDPLTLAPEPESLERALSSGPCALVLVHLYGVPVDVDSAARAAAARGIVVIEDAAQGIGASLRGQPAGSLGSVAVLSFGRGKGLTGGSGGALLANDEAGVHLLQRAAADLQGTRAGWPDLARACVQWLFGRPSLYALPAALPFLRLGETVYHPPTRPSVLSRAAAGMIIKVWKPALEAAARRRAHAVRLNAAARASGQWRTIPLTRDAVPGYLRLPLIAEGQARNILLDRTAGKLGIIQGYPLPLMKLSHFAERCVNARDTFPGATLLAERLLTLPTHELLSERDLAALQRWLYRTKASRTPASTGIMHLEAL